MRYKPLPCDLPNNPSPCARCGATDENKGCPLKSERYDQLATLLDNIAANLAGDQSKLSHGQMLFKLGIIRALTAHWSATIDDAEPKE